MNIPNKIIVTLLCLFISIASFGKEKTRVVIKDCKSGQLEELIKEKGYDAFKIERLTVKGEIELRDVLFIRSLEQLKVLDLANVTIIDDIKSEPPETISRANTLSFRLFMIDGLPAGEMVPKKLERIVLPKNLEELSEGVFSGYKERYALLAGEIRLPRTLKRIDIEVFAYTKISYKLPLPISLAYIGSARILAKGTLQLPLNLTYLNVAEFECPNIEAFALPDENPNYTVVDGVLFSKDKTVLILYPRGREGSYVIPPHVKKIGNRAFLGCKKLDKIDLNVELESIGEFAFVHCHKLTDMKLNGNRNVIGQLKVELDRKWEYSKESNVRVK